MDVFARLFVKLSGWCHPYAAQIAMAMAATTLAVYNDMIDNSVRKALRNRSFAIRFLAFVLLYAFGYGALTVLASALLARWLSHLGGVWLFATVFVFFALIGLAAERRRKI